MNPVLKKLWYKSQTSCLVYGAPGEFHPVVEALSAQPDTAPQGTYDWAIAFARSLQDAEAIARTLPPFLEERAIFWVAYPKGTSRRTRPTSTGTLATR